MRRYQHSEARAKFFNGRLPVKELGRAALVADMLIGGRLV